jgi:hypothetical protein
MRLASDHYMIQALAPDRSNSSFGKAILPARGRCNRFVPNAHGSQSACDNGAAKKVFPLTGRSTTFDHLLGDG